MTVRGLIELLLALVIMQSQGYCSGFRPWLTCLSFYAVVSVRAIFSENFDLVAGIFLAAYTMINLAVNSIDYCIFKVSQGYQEDYIFHQMFSYKLFQGMLCLIMSFVFAQVLNPSFEIIRENPHLLGTVFNLTLWCCGLLIFCFLYELQFYELHLRATIFKTELNKVFFTVLATYLVAIIYSSWMQSLVEYSQKTQRQWQKYHSERRAMTREYEETKDQGKLR